MLISLIKSIGNIGEDNVRAAAKKGKLGPRNEQMCTRLGGGRFAGGNGD